MFFLTMFLMDGAAKEEPKTEINNKFGYDNNIFINDDGRVSTLELPRLHPPPSHRFENSKL